MDEKQNIKIFVSHRIDLDAEPIKNPLYCHMRCGAVDDEREGMSIAGDDTGDNISYKHDRYSEFTVQYWAWKNCDADYYGLCHYRRYLSFADQEFPTKQFQGFVEEQTITEKVIKKYCLNSAEEMYNKIVPYDAVVGKSFDIENMPDHIHHINLFELFQNHPRIVISREILELLTQLVRERFPQYYPALLERWASQEVIGFNCFVMKKELFSKMCDFEFDIMKQLENQIDFSSYEGNSVRIIGYLGEILYGTFIQWMKDEGYAVDERQMILFWKPQAVKKANEKAKKKWGEETYCQTKSTEKLKKIWLKISPSYRLLTNIQKQQKQEKQELNKLQKEIVNLDKKVTATTAAITKIDSAAKSLKTDVSKVTAIATQVRNKQQLDIWLSQPKFPDDLTQVKKDFWRSYPQAEGDLRAIQYANLCLLHRLKKLCDEIGVRFWLHGGSLVGAVRHSGYVPWDDDIDVGMMRADFVRLKELLSEDAYYKIQDIYYTSLACRSYRFMRKENDANIFVDIFLYDYYQPTQDTILNDWWKLIDFKLALRTQFAALVAEYKLKPHNEALDDIPELKARLDKLIDLYCGRIISDTPTDWIAWGLDNNYENASRFAWHHGRIFNASDIFPLAECDFENEKMYIPNNYEKYVYAEYGVDYLDMPGDIGISKHVNIYFSHPEDIEGVKQLIADEEKRGM